MGWKRYKQIQWLNVTQTKNKNLELVSYKILGPKESLKNFKLVRPSHKIIFFWKYIKTNIKEVRETEARKDTTFFIHILISKYFHPWRKIQLTHHISY